MKQGYGLADAIKMEIDNGGTDRHVADIIILAKQQNWNLTVWEDVVQTIEESWGSSAVPSIKRIVQQRAASAPRDAP